MVNAGDFDGFVCLYRVHLDESLTGAVCDCLGNGDGWIRPVHDSSGTGALDGISGLRRPLVVGYKSIDCVRFCDVTRAD